MSDQGLSTLSLCRTTTIGNAAIRKRRRVREDACEEMRAKRRVQVGKGHVPTLCMRTRTALEPLLRKLQSIYMYIHMYIHMYIYIALIYTYVYIYPRSWCVCVISEVYLRNTLPVQNIHTKKAELSKKHATRFQTSKKHATRSKYTHKKGRKKGFYNYTCLHTLSQPQ